jgi:RNA polymerase sigma factor (TIGR02999 family)
VTRKRPQSDGKPGCSEPQAARGLLPSRTASAEIRLIAAELLPAFYDQLKHIAQRARSRLGGNNTLQTTALVHEAYLRLRHSPGFADKTHFLRAAALAMRHALINYAAARIAEKRGGGQLHLTLSSAEAVGVDTDEELLELNEALERLAGEIPRLADVIECRFFGGYGEEDTARALGLSLRTVQRDWLKARAWLYRELGGAI